MPDREATKKLGAWFLGPKAENADLEEKMISYILQDYFHWRRNYFPSDEILITQSLRREATPFNDLLFQQIMEMLAGLRRHFPFYSPRYIAHMLSDQTIPGVLGYFAGMLYNPNNVTPEAAPVTVKWEMDVGADMLRMLGYVPPPALGTDSKEEFGWAHITGGGTVANLEALWIARAVRYFALAVRDCLSRHNIPLIWKVPGAGDHRDLREFDAAECLGIRPGAAIYLLPRFVEAVRRRYAITRQEAAARAFELLAESEFSIAHHGVRGCYAARPPVLFAGGSRHYSIDKAADLLGIGKENIILVDLDPMFRMDLRDLEAKLNHAIERGMLPLGVVAIAASTEEGAVDPIHRIAALRGDLEARGHTFWLHIDAAWGGYFRSLFHSGTNETPEQCAAEVRQFVRRDLTISSGRYQKHLSLQWGFPDLCAAFQAFPLAESITVDPHKMGYVPYPCGIAAFRNDMVRHFLTEEAPYISDASEEDIAQRKHQPPASIGPYILEGSKSGAAVAACWLSHRMIPPSRDGYGEIMRASLLAARELYERLIHFETAARVNNEEPGFRFVPVTSMPPDTNIVCFVVAEDGPVPLDRRNRLNRAVYQRFTIDAEHGASQYSYLQPYFLSRTTFRPPGYSASALSGLLHRLGVDPVEYHQQGLFVLRATLMSPYLTLAPETGHKQELLAAFLEELARRTREAWHDLPRPL
jgi:glutamate/tyrosine decarboxylase-like PLP-dependent enzyme